VNEQAHTSTTSPHATENAALRDAQRVIHRVCIQCNNMFRVTPDRFDAKQCPNCHKG
jgi:hypothetical protein